MNTFRYFRIQITAAAALAVLGSCTTGENGSHQAKQPTNAHTTDVHGTDGHNHAATKYTCPMHPEVVQSAPGQCPICGMNLVPVVKKAGMNAPEVILNDRQMQLANISVRPVSAGSGTTFIVANARLMTDPRATRVVSSRVAGRVERLYVKEIGQAVRAGQPLYELYAESLLTDQQEYLIALRQVEELGQQDSRYETFRRAAEQKLRLYGMTSSQIRELAKTRNVRPRVTFVAPASGTVLELNATEGQYVEEGAPLYQVGDLTQLWVEADLYAGEAANVRVGDAVRVQATGDPQSAVTARVILLSPEYRAGTQIVTLRAALPNAQLQFRPGMRATVAVERGHGPADASPHQRQSLMLPAEAVIRTADGAHVYVQTTPRTFQPRHVTTGTESGDQIAILSGLTDKESVVMSGAYLLYSETVLKNGVSHTMSEM